ncbi:MAG: hypothetical protein DRG50_08445, partial [Deltaproteobacteria bacterium]
MVNYMVKSGEGVKAVVLAAGVGSRLKGQDPQVAKPLINLLGLSLLERTILSCREVGIRDFLVIVGAQKEQVISHLKRLRQRHSDLSIQTVENPNWTFGNGTSALAVEPYIHGSFLLLMCDHVFDPAILKRLLSVEDKRDVCWLAVDIETKLSPSKVGDATKVYIEDGRIVAIGKDLSTFNGVDTGLFLCHPTLFDALKSAQAEGDYSLSGGIRKLIEKGKLAWVSVDRLFWYDVDTPEDLKEVQRALVANVSKPQEDGWISRHLNRYLSRLLSS